MLRNACKLFYVIPTATYAQVIKMVGFPKAMAEKEIRKKPAWLAVSSNDTR